MMTEISKTNEILKCPFCENDLEKGCVLGHSSISGAFRWFAGEPTLKKNLFGTFMRESIELAKIDNLMAGPYLTGFRCKRCQKVILDY